jgi:hypothetical protein
MNVSRPADSGWERACKNLFAVDPNAAVSYHRSIDDLALRVESVMLLLDDPLRLTEASWLPTRAGDDETGEKCGALRPG